jgi:hypothetical protein
VSEPKPFASLSSGLLARKGAARPAMKPQGFGQMGGGNLEDLGWNDMGFEPPKPAVVPLRDADHDAFGEEIDGEARVHPTGLTPVQSPVHSQQSELADRLGAEGEELGETAELLDAEPEALPLIQVPAPAPRRAPRPRAAPGSKGQGSLYAAPRSAAASQAASRLCRERPLGAANRD